MLILANLGHDPKHWPSEAATAADQTDDRGALLACGGRDSGRPFGGSGGRSPPTKAFLVSPTGGYGGLQENLPWGGSAHPDPPNWSAAVAASEGQEGPTVIALVGRCRGLRRPVFGVMSKISMSSQDDLGQGPACSALAMDP